MSGFELAVHLPSLDALTHQQAMLAGRSFDLIRLADTAIELERTGWAAATHEVQARAGSTMLSRIYFGSEVCSGLLPTIGEAREAASRITAAGLAGSLVVGVVSEDAFLRTMRIAEAFVGACPGAEVVANDWGFAAAAARRGFAVELGRFLFRVKRMPRSGETLPVPHVPAGADAAAVLAGQESELSIHPADLEAFATFARSLAGPGCRIQTELVPQGLKDDPAPKLPCTLLLPWTYVTGGGECPLHPPGPEGCGRPCRDGYVVPVYSAKYRPIVHAGRAVFSLSLGLIPSFVAMKRFDRVVLEPSLPL